MNARIGNEVDDYCTRCHRLTNHTVAAMVADDIASTTCRTCGFNHSYKGGKAPQRAPKKSTAFDEVLAGIIGTQPPPPEHAPPKRKRGK